MLTQQRLKELLNYNTKTGLFRATSNRGRIKSGAVVGSKRPDGYIQIIVDYKIYLAHRLAWLYFTGHWPEGIIDHKDRIKNHNWIKNLRDVSYSENMQNSNKPQSNNTLKVRNVCFDKRRNTFEVEIHINKKKIYIGSFKTLKLAEKAAIAAKKEHHKAFI